MWIRKQREALACRRLLGLNFYLLPLMNSLGLDLFSWYTVEIKHERLVSSPGATLTFLQVDLLGVTLNKLTLVWRRYAVRILLGTRPGGNKLQLLFSLKAGGSNGRPQWNT
jgi:hypothetical protein